MTHRLCLSSPLLSVLLGQKWSNLHLRICPLVVRIVLPMVLNVESPRGCHEQDEVLDAAKIEISAQHFDYLAPVNKRKLRRRILYILDSP